MKLLLINVCLILEGVSRFGGRCDSDEKISTACFGSKMSCTSHSLKCHDDYLHINILNATYGIKNQITFLYCLTGVPACTDYYKTCCKQDTGDVFIVYKDNHMNNLIQQCSGKRTCSFQAPRIENVINGAKKQISSYSLIQYKCFNETMGALPTASPTTSPVGGIVGGIIVVIVVAVIVVVGVIFYRRRQQQKDAERAAVKKQKPAISGPSALCSINGIDIGTAENEYSQIDDSYQTQSERVVTPYKIANVGSGIQGSREGSSTPNCKLATRGNENEPTYNLATEVSGDEPAYNLATELSEDEPAYNLATELSEEEPTYRLATEVSGDEPTYKLAKEVSEDEGGYNTMFEMTPSSRGAGDTENCYNHITFEQAKLHSENDYSHVTGSLDRQGEDPDYGYNHFDTATREPYQDDDYDTMQTHTATSGVQPNTSDYNTSW